MKNAREKLVFLCVFLWVCHGDLLHGQTLSVVPDESETLDTLFQEEDVENFTLHRNEQETVSEEDIPNGQEFSSKNSEDVKIASVKEPVLHSSAVLNGESAAQQPSQQGDLSQEKENIADSFMTTDMVVLRGLHKVTGRVMTIQARVGEEISFEKLRVVVHQCRKAPPEETPESVAFLSIKEVVDKQTVVSVFNAWMFASNPNVSALEHPVYDLWVAECVTPLIAFPDQASQNEGEGQKSAKGSLGITSTVNRGSLQNTLSEKSALHTDLSKKHPSYLVSEEDLPSLSEEENAEEGVSGSQEETDFYPSATH